MALGASPSQTQAIKKAITGTPYSSLEALPAGSRESTTAQVHHRQREAQGRRLHRANQPEGKR